MGGNELIALLSNNLPVIQSCVGPITGALIAAFFLRRNTEVQEFEKLKAGKFSEVINDLLASGKMTYTEFYKADNFLKIAELADETVKREQHEDKSKLYEFDWFVRFYEAAGNISGEKMQVFWAKLLAGEIVNPSNFSLKTIDVLKNLRQSDAELFAKVCSHSTFHNKVFFLPHYENFLKECKVNYSEILYLSELGLINADGTLQLTLRLPQRANTFFPGRNSVLFIENGKDTTFDFKVNVYPFTEVGAQLAKLQECIATTEDLILLSKELLREEKVEIKVHPVVNQENGCNVYDNTVNLLEK